MGFHYVSYVNTDVHIPEDDNYAIHLVNSKYGSQFNIIQDLLGTAWAGKVHVESNGCSHYKFTESKCYGYVISFYFDFY